MFHLDWNLNVGTVASVLIAAFSLFVGLAKLFWSAHTQNQLRLASIETRQERMESDARPVHEWFKKHVIENWRG